MSDKKSKYKMQRDNYERQMNEFAEGLDHWNVSHTLVWGETEVSTKKENETIIDHFLKNQDHQFQLFLEKNKNYGKDNILSENNPEAITESLYSIYVRMQDKLNRFRRLIQQVENTSDESIQDTLDDLANYANIANIVSSGKWE